MLLNKGKSQLLKLFLSLHFECSFAFQYMFQYAYSMFYQNIMELSHFLCQNVPVNFTYWITIVEYTII